MEDWEDLPQTQGNELEENDFDDGSINQNHNYGLVVPTKLSITAKVALESPVALIASSSSSSSSCTTSFFFVP